MLTLITAILGSALKFGLILFGDSILAKWISQAKLWWRELQEPVLKAKVEASYKELSAQWDNLQQDRKPGPRG